MKKRARYFLERDLVHFVASDMHNLDQRPPYMKEAYEIVQNNTVIERRENYYRNPRIILADQII